MIANTCAHASASHQIIEQMIYKMKLLKVLTEKGEVRCLLHGDWKVNIKAIIYFKYKQFLSHIKVLGNSFDNIIIKSSPPWRASLSPLEIRNTP